LPSLVPDKVGNSAVLICYFSLSFVYLPVQNIDSSIQVEFDFGSELLKVLKELFTDHGVCLSDLGLNSVAQIHHLLKELRLVL
jgi:hypothetical protein